MESLNSRRAGRILDAKVLAWTRSTAARLACLGLASTLMYALGLAARYPVRASFQVPRATWSSLVDTPGTALASHLAIYAGVTLAYVFACRLTWRRLARPKSSHGMTHPGQERGILPVIVGGWLASSIVLLGVAPGGESHDVFDYLFRGRMWIELGGNPLADTPKQFSSAPFYKYVAWHSHVDTYGPIWEYVSGSVAVLVRYWLQATERWGSGLPSCPEGTASCGMLSAYVGGYRLAAIALAGVCGWLIYVLVRHSRPTQAPTALLIWLWNPLLLIATAVGAHNDLVMLVPVLMVFWAFQRQYWLAGLLLFVLAVHVKMTALILTPVVGLWLVRRIGWGRTLVRGVLALLVALPISWLLYEPLGGWGTLPRMLRERAIFRANSPWRLLHQILYVNRDWPKDTVHILTVYMPTVLFVVALLIICLKRLGYRQHSDASAIADDALWSTAALVTVTYLALGSFWFQHWYVLWCLAPAALLPGNRYVRLALPWLCFGALASNVLNDLAPQLPMLQLDRTQVISLVVAVIWLPALAAAAYVWRTQRDIIAPSVVSESY
jgi:hypothetical protein